jgi:hypothetical protein
MFLRRPWAPALSDNVQIFRNGQSVALSQLSSGTIPSGQITYARANWQARWT